MSDADAASSRQARLETLGATLASVAHELNNPLTAIAGFAQILLEGERSAEDRAALETIYREAVRSARLVRELLMLARGVEREPRAAVDLNDVVRHVVKTRTYAMHTHGITCVLDLAEPLPPVFGHTKAFEQVVLNLVTNAERAARTGADASGGANGRVAVSTRVEGDDVVLVVEDSGSGLPDDAGARVWEPFWSRANDGSGLGLHVVRSIVERHGGNVRAENGALGGARFEVRVPRSRATAEETARRALDIVVVHSDPEEAEFLARFFSARNHAVLTASSTTDAIALLGQVAFDVVVAGDAQFEALTTSDAAAPNRHTRIVRAGAPVDLEQLRHAVEESEAEDERK